MSPASRHSRYTLWQRVMYISPPPPIFMAVPTVQTPTRMLLSNLLIIRLAGAPSANSVPITKYQHGKSIRPTIKMTVIANQIGTTTIVMIMIATIMIAMITIAMIMIAMITIAMITIATIMIVTIMIATMIANRHASRNINQSPSPASLTTALIVAAKLTSLSSSEFALKL
jgi:hypothetical protein